MGMPMRDIHTPDVVSASHSAPNGSQAETASVQELLAQKNDLETQLQALGSVLESHGVNMNTGLTTFDGFPRSDIDVAQIRTIRAKIIPLRNDHKALMARIENAVTAHFAAAAAEPAPVPATAALPPNLSSRLPSATTPTFARVNSVVDNSPAAAAGLKAGDRIQNFGDANWLNHDKLAKVARIVTEMEGRQLPVDVLRDDVQCQLILTPQRDWGGRGLLGCHLVLE